MLVQAVSQPWKRKAIQPRPVYNRVMMVYRGNPQSAASGTNTLAGLTGKVMWNDSPSLSTGILHNCALTTKGDVMCWGTATSAGSDYKENQHVPTKVEGVSNAVHISAGDNYSCAVTAGGNVACWTHGGNATYLQEGSDRLANIVQVSTNYYGKYACALTAVGSVKCWWSEDISYGGKLIQRAAQPLQVLDRDGNVLSGIAQVVVGGGITQAGYQSSAVSIQSGEDDPVGIQANHCFLTVAGGVKCWHSTFLSPDSPPKYYHDDVLQKYWPDFPDGVMRTGTDGNSSPLANVVQISAGELHFCGVTSLDTGGKVMCWGQESHGRLGGINQDGWVVTDDGSPLSGIVSVTAGMQSTCAIDKNGAAWCWGYGRWCSFPVLGKQCSDIHGIFYEAKKISTPPGGFSSIAGVFGEHACGLAKNTSTSTSVYCWGKGGEGQAGIDPSTMPSSNSAPVHFDVRLPVPNLVVPHRRARFGCNSSACTLKVGNK